MIIAFWIFVGFFSVVTISLLWIVFVPISLLVDTAVGQYYVCQTGTFSASAHPFASPAFKARVFGFPLSVNPRKTIPPINTEKKTNQHKSKPRSIESWKRLIQRTLRSIRVKQLIIHVDSGDVVTNAKLFPLAYFLSRSKNAQVSINYNGEVYGHLEAQVRLYIIVGAFIKHMLNI